jgi:hypothetical protein
MEQEASEWPEIDGKLIARLQNIYSPLWVPQEGTSDAAIWKRFGAIQLILDLKAIHDSQQKI